MYVIVDETYMGRPRIVIKKNGKWVTPSGELTSNPKKADTFSSEYPAQHRIRQLEGK